jgi:Fic family protein
LASAIDCGSVIEGKDPGHESCGRGYTIGRRTAELETRLCASPLILNMMLEGFEGKLTSTKWAKLAKSSQDTAHRDILDLIHHHILIKDSAGGRSTSYSLKEA